MSSPEGLKSDWNKFLTVWPVRWDQNENIFFGLSAFVPTTPLARLSLERTKFSGFMIVLPVPKGL
jgi:hypothetical protein